MNHFWKGFEKGSSLPGEQAKLASPSLAADPLPSYQKEASSLPNKIRKTVGWGIIGGTAAAAGVGKLTADPDVAMGKQARAEKPQDPKEKVRNDISRYENQKKLRKIYSVGRLGSMGVAAAGGFRKDPKLVAGGLGGAFLTGFLRGHASKEERSALGRIKQHYDLRDNSKFINIGALVPQQEKTAIVSSILDAAIGMVNSGAHLAVPSIHSFGNAATVGLDILTVPWLAQRTAKALRSIGATAARKSQNMPITGGQNMLLGAADMAKGFAQSSASLPARLHAGATNTGSNALMRGFYAAANRVSKNPLGKYLTNLPAGILSTMSTGKKGGELAGELLTQVQKVSPKYHELGVKALDPGLGTARLVNQATKDMKAVSGAWDAFSHQTTIGRFIKRRGGDSGQSLITRYLEDSSKAMADVDNIKMIERSTGNALKALAAAGAVGVAGSLLGEHRSRHPLAEDALPLELATAKKRGPAIKPPLSAAVAT